MDAKIIISHVADAIDRTEPLSERQRAALAGSLGLCLWKIEISGLQDLVNVLSEQPKDYEVSNEENN